MLIQQDSGNSIHGTFTNISANTMLSYKVLILIPPNRVTAPCSLERVHNFGEAVACLYRKFLLLRHQGRLQGTHGHQPWGPWP